MNFGTCCRTPYTKRNRALLVVGHVAVGVLLAALLAMLFGWVIALLWNHILPDLLGAGRITYWQSVGLLVMVRILVGGFHQARGHGNGHRARHETWQDYDAWWREVGQASFQAYAGQERDPDRKD